MNFGKKVCTCNHFGSNSIPSFHSREKPWRPKAHWLVSPDVLPPATCNLSPTTGKWPFWSKFFENSFQMASIAVSRGKNRKSHMSQGVDTRGSLISVPLAFREATPFNTPSQTLWIWQWLLLEDRQPPDPTTQIAWCLHIAAVGGQVLVVQCQSWECLAVYTHPCVSREGKSVTEERTPCLSFLFFVWIPSFSPLRNSLFFERFVPSFPRVFGGSARGLGRDRKPCFLVVFLAINNKTKEDRAGNDLKKYLWFRVRRFTKSPRLL